MAGYFGGASEEFDNFETEPPAIKETDSPKVRFVHTYSLVYPNPAILRFPVLI